MTIELALILGLTAALAFLVWEYIRLHKIADLYTKIKKETLEKTHRKAMNILDEAREEAAKIIKEARIGVVAHREKLTAKMDAALTAVAEREITDFKKALEMETINIEKTVGQKVAARYDEVAKEIEGYKAKQIAGIDQKLNKVIVEMAQKILSKTINAREHQELVIKALEEARKNGLFD